MEFWNSLLTEKSWTALSELKKKPFGFVLIGGWAVYLLTKLQKSKDIDIIMKDIKDMDYLKKEPSLIKNDRLRKYELKIADIAVDIYVPFYSKLAIPTEEAIRQTIIFDDLHVVLPEVLLVLKQGAEFARKDTIKGTKDRIDIMSLLIYSDFDVQKYRQIIKKYDLEHYPKRLREIIGSFTETDHLNLNLRQFKLKKQALLEKL